MKGYITTTHKMDPCKFCKASQAYVYQCFGIDSLLVICKACRANGPSVKTEDATEAQIKEVIRRWNQK